MVTILFCRYKRLQSELSNLKTAYAEAKEALKSATKHNDELHDQIELLGKEMVRKESQTVSRHLHHAVTISMHAICHNVLHNPSTDEGQSGHPNSSSSGTPLEEAHNTTSTGSMESGICSLTAEDRDHPVCEGTEGSGASSVRSEVSSNIDCSRCNEKRQEYQTLADNHSNSLESSGSEVSEEESFKYVMAGVGLHGNPLFQPINHTKIQWWMVSKSDYEVSTDMCYCCCCIYYFIVVVCVIVVMVIIIQSWDIIYLTVHRKIGHNVACANVRRR